MKTIKYQGKRLKISDEDYQGIIYARSVGYDVVDIQQPDKNKFKVVWLNISDIKE